VNNHWREHHLMIVATSSTVIFRSDVGSDACDSIMGLPD
jgi:hypothetical protein